MNNLKNLYTDLLNAKTTYTKGIENIHKKAKEIGDVKTEITGIKSRVIEIQRTLNNTRKGIGLSVSASEFTSLKLELEDINIKLENLQDILPIHEEELRDLNKQSQYNSRSERELISQITDIIANQAASDIAISADSKLKELTYTAIVQYGFYFKNSQDDYNCLYKDIGEKLCKQLFTTDTGSIVLPTSEQAKTERDLLIDNIT